MDSRSHASVFRPFVGKVLLAALLTFAGCSEPPSAPAPLSSKEKEILAVARETLEQLEDWGAVAEYKIKRTKGHWEVVAWKVVHPEAKGNLRYVPWGKTTMRIEDNGHVSDYRKGK